MRQLPAVLAGAALLAACGGTPRTAPAPVQAIATTAEIQAAGSLITADNVGTRIGAIADDSMEGRNTPSAGLERTAAYLAANYSRWGLQPLGDSGSYIQRYTLRRVRAGSGSYLDVNEAGTVTRLPLDRDALVAGPMTGAAISAPVKVIAGDVKAGDIAPLDLHGKFVLVVERTDRVTDNQLVLRALNAQRPAAILVVQDGDPVAFHARVDSARHWGNPRPVVDGVPPAGVLTITVQDPFFAALPDAPDFGAMRRATAPMIIDGPLTVTVSLLVAQEVVSSASAPNVVAVMPGSDSVLRNEYVVFSAHMDHVGRAGDGVGGCTAKGADSICNGADDDGSGTTGILSIAQAVGNLHGRTRRSIIVLNVSGEEKGLLGSAYFTSHPTVPLDHVVADINMDMIGRNNPDSIVVIGKEHSDLGGTLAQVQAAHPELHLVAADDIWPEQNFYSRSDHFNFARQGVPILFFFNGLHPQYHRPDDEVGLIDTDKLARVAKLGFFFGVQLADTVPRPQWNPASYQKIVVQQQVP